MNKTFKTTILGLLVNILIRFLHLTMRMTHIDKHHETDLVKAKTNYIFCFWHQHIMLMPFALSKKKVGVLSSPSKDGLIAAASTRFFGHVNIWGSSNRGPAHAFKSMVRYVKNTHSICITVDGPKGPPLVAKPGALGVARLSKAPILPVVFWANPAKKLKSWDQFLVPKPFSKGVYVYGKPYFAQGDPEEEAIKLTEIMNQLTAKAKLLCGEESGDES